MIALIWLIPCCLIGLLTVHYVYKYLKQCWLLRSFRGPLALPLVGNVYSSECIYFMRYLAKLRKKYGKVYTFFAFTKPYLVVCDPAAVRRILSDSKAFIKGEDYSKLFSICFGFGLVTSIGDKHRHDRGVLGKYFIRNNISKYMQNVNDITTQAIATTLTEEQKISSSHNIEEFFALLALRVFFAFALSFKTDPKVEHHVAKTVSKGSFEMGRIVGLGLPPYDFVPPVRYVREAAEELWVEHFKKIVEDRKALMYAGNCDIDDCLTAMIKDNFNDKDMKDHMITLIAAGHDTTAFFSSYMCFLLASHPESQEKLRQEINTVVGDSPVVTADHVAEMKYLAKVMQETLRLYSIIPCVSRTAAETVHIKEANLTIPEGITTLIPMYLINRDPELWDQPSDYNPDRFDNKNCDFTSAKNGFFPFGYGARTCIGNTLAQLESSVFLVHLLKKYRFKAKPGFKPAIIAGISLTTSNGIHIILEEL